MKNLKTFEGWFSSKKEEEIIQPEGSVFKAEEMVLPPNFTTLKLAKSSTGKRYNVYYEKNDIVGTSDFVVVESPNGDLILSGDPNSKLLNNKRIKVPSIERALMYLTDLKKKSDDKKEEDKNKFDEEIN